MPVIITEELVKTFKFELEPSDINIIIDALTKEKTTYSFRTPNEDKINSIIKLFNSVLLND
tara:strand:- start:665 stop:847 length:183 start_codon:yes stop_codon:yes gene_type:complete